MSSSKSRPTRETTLFADITYALRYYLRGRRGLLLGAAAAVIFGLLVNWQWLITLSVVPLLLSILPCAAMCALGLCMHKLGKSKGAGSSNSSSTPSDKLSQTVEKSDDAA